MSVNFEKRTYFRGMYYYLILALNGFCLYHCYINRKPYFWYFVIFFIPVLGSLAYLFTQVFGQRDIDKVQEGLVSVINPSKKITDLEKQLQFAETFENKVALADAYLEAEIFEKAIETYEAALKGTFQNDFYVLSRLEEAYYFSSRFDEAIACAEKIKDNPKFKKNKAVFLYGLALEKNHQITAAEEQLKKFDAPYSHYQERLVLGQFYMRNKRPEAAKEVLQEIVHESERMSKQNYRTHRVLIKKASEILATLA
ncbi:hypothetical protein [Spongiimicrobium salis]|uniref:hypothetical protein n=1 Tax=Spongiimicrobium salis TaxID=1667022 RepID=UPI00374CD12B